MTILRAFLASAFCVALAASAAAETKLSDFTGEWSGRGQDRDLPLVSLEAVTCQNGIRANPKRLHSEMTCERQSGVRNAVQMTVTLEGNQLSGKITRKVTRPGDQDDVISGTVSGTKTGDTANLLVRWDGATPNTTIALKLTTPTSYSMQATALGATMKDQTFRSTSSERPLPRNSR
jgi:hypothetical protein